jgi:hypothetical protein
MAPLPPADSIIRITKDWEQLHYEEGAILSYINDVFYYPSHCSSKRTFAIIYLPTQKAIDLWKEQSFSYNPNFQVLNINKVVSLKANGTEIPADVSRNEVVFKSLEPGDCMIMEWLVKNYYQGKMANSVYGSESFQFSYPTYDHRLRLITPEKDTIPYSAYGDSIMVKRKKMADYCITIFSRSPYKATPDETFVATDFPKHRKIVYSTFSSWGEISDWYLDLSQNKQSNSLEITALADSLFKDAQSPREKVAMVHEFIAENIRYSYVPFRQSGWVPQTARDVLATKIGDCKDMSSLGKSLLDRAGIQSSLVLVNTNYRHFNGHLYVGPNFNHCILSCKLNGEQRFIDFTDNNLSMNTLPKANQGAMALLIERGNTNLLTLPMDTAEKRVKRRKIVSVLGKDGVLSRNVESLRTGVYAGEIRYFYRFKSKEERDTDLHKVLSSSYPDLSLTSLEFSGLESLGDSIHYVYAYDAKNTVTFSGKTAIFPLKIPDNISPNSFPVEEERNFPVDMHDAWYNVSKQVMEGELTYPEEWRLVDTPSTVELESPYGTYSLKFLQKGNKIIYRRNAVFKFYKLLTVDEYPQLTEFLKKISKADAIQLVFFTS